MFVKRRNGRWERSRAGKMRKRSLVFQTSVLRDMKAASRYESQEGLQVVVNQMCLVPFPVVP